SLVLDAVGFDKRLVGADLVITGEGRIDGQSVYGKLTHGVTVAAKRRGVPVVAVAGIIGDGHQAMRDAGIEAIETLAGESEAERDAAMADPLPRIEAAAERLARGRAPARGSRGTPAREPLRRGLHARTEEHTSELQSRLPLICRLLPAKKTT